MTFAQWWLGTIEISFLYSCVSLAGWQGILLQFKGGWRWFSKCVLLYSWFEFPEIQEYISFSEFYVIRMSIFRILLLMLKFTASFFNFSHSFVYTFLISSNVLSYSLFLYNNNITQHAITCMVTCRCWNTIFILLLFILECFSKPFIIIGVNVCGCECLKMFLSQVTSILAL